MIAWEHVCVDDSNSEGNDEIKEYNDNYNNDDQGEGDNVVGNNNANLVTIAASALVCLKSEKKEEESKIGEETVDKIDDDGDLKRAAKYTHFIIRHDKDSVDITDEGGKGKNKEFDSLFNHDDDDTDLDQEGGGVLLVTMIQRWQ